MRRALLMVSLLMLLCVTTIADQTAEPVSVAPGPPTYQSFDFSQWPLEGWVDVREERFPEIGTWVVGDEAITNAIPEDADEKDIIAMKNGIGMASSIIDGLQLADLTAILVTSFERKGAPSVLLRARVDGELTGEMLSLVLYEKGVNLWRFDGAKWHKAGFAQFPVEPGVFHRMKIRLLGSTARVWVDGKRVFDSEDVGLEGPGALGIWAGEGPCHFQSLRLKYTAQ